MRVLMLEPPARDQHAGVGQSFDHCLVGVALFAFVREHALTSKSRSLFGEAAIGIDSIGNCRIDAARGEFARMGGPDVKIFAAMSRRGVDKSSTGILGDMIAGKQRHLEIVAT